MPVNFQSLLDILSLGPKHPVRDKFNEVHFLAGVDKHVGELNENRSEVEKLCELEASAKLYAESLREIPMDRGVKKCMLIYKPMICWLYHLT